MRNVPIIMVRIEPAGMPGVSLNVSSLVLSLKYEDCADKADKFSLTVDNDSLVQFDLPIWRSGNTLYLRWGYSEAMSVERKTTIKKVTGFRVLTIEALGGELQLAKFSRTRTFPAPGEPAVTRSQVAKKVAADWGFADPALQHIQDTTRLYDALHQKNQTDLQFMGQMAREEHYDFYVDHDGFHFHAKEWIAAQNDYAPAKVLTYFSDQSPTEILDVHIENDITVKTGSVKVKTWNPIERHGIDLDRTNATQSQKDSLAKILEVPGMGEWNVAGIGAIGTHKTKHSARTPFQDVVADADNALASSQQTAVKLKLTIVGDPLLFAKSVIEVRGLGRRLSQRYWVRQVDHTIDDAYTCSVECESAGSNGHKTDITTPVGVVRIQPLPKNPAHKAPSTHRNSSGIDILDPNGPIPTSIGAPVPSKIGQPAAKLAPGVVTIEPPEPGPVTDPTEYAPVEPIQLPELPEPESSSIGVGDRGAVVPQLGAKDGEIKTPLEAASQQELMAAYQATADQPELPESDPSRQYLYSGLPAGDVIAPGNLDLDHRPYVTITDEEGNSGTATIYSMNFQPYEYSEINVLVPKVSEDGRLMSNEEAIATYESTGKHLGVYKDWRVASEAGERIHVDQVVNPPTDSLAVRKSERLTPAQRKRLEAQ